MGTQPLHLRNISEDTTAFPWAKRTPWQGLRASLAVGLSLVIGRLCGHPSAGAIAAGSAFTVGFAVFHEALASTLLSMGLLTLGIASGTLAGSLGAGWTPVVLVLVLVASINYGLLADLGPTSSWIGQQCAVFVVVASYFPQGTRYAVGRTEMVFAGGALQMLFFLGFRFSEGGRPQPPPEAALVPRFSIRLRQLFSRLREEVRWGSWTVWYIVRLMLAVGISTAIYRGFQLRNGYWAPMTAVLVLKPQWSNTLSRGIARLSGTLIGAGLAFALALWVPLPPWETFALAVVAAWGCYATQAVNYALFSVCVTLYIVYLFRFGGFSERSAAHLRLLNTAIGGGIALGIDALWKLLAPKAATELRTIERL
jgi:hypothetical protein